MNRCNFNSTIKQAAPLFCCTETIYEDVMVVPFYLEGLRLAPVTGIQGYPSTWPTFLRYLSVAKIPEGGKYGNSGLL